MKNSDSWLLALDLSGDDGLLVLEGADLSQHRLIEGDMRVRKLFPSISEVMRMAGITPAEIGLVGVGRGPGSFTGVRVAVMAAKTMAQVLSIPLVAPDSLEISAMNSLRPEGRVFVASDARRGEVYYALYGWEEGYPRCILGPSVAVPESAAAELQTCMGQPGGEIFLAGSGIAAYSEVWPGELGRAPETGPPSAGLAAICRMYHQDGRVVDPLQLLPLYIRRPDARAGFSWGGGG